MYEEKNPAPFSLNVAKPSSRKDYTLQLSQFLQHHTSHSPWRIRSSVSFLPSDPGFIVIWDVLILLRVDYILITNLIH